MQCVLWSQYTGIYMSTADDQTRDLVCIVSIQNAYYFQYAIPIYERFSIQNTCICILFVDLHIKTLKQIGYFWQRNFFYKLYQGTWNNTLQVVGVSRTGCHHYKSTLGLYFLFHTRPRFYTLTNCSSAQNSVFDYLKI